MDFFQVENGPGKIARDLTANAILMSTSKYVKDGPQPVGTYKPNSVLPQEKYGARKLKTKSEASEKKISESSKQGEPPQIQDFAVIQNQQKYSQNHRGNVIGNFVQTYVKTQPNQVESPNNGNVRGMNRNNSSRTTEIKEQSKINIVQTVYQNQKSLGNRTPQPIRYGALQKQESVQKGQQKNDQPISQTPQPARYGAQRRIQTQQVSQVQTPIQPETKTQKPKLKIETQIQKTPDQAQLQPTPKSVQSSIGRQNSKATSQISTPVQKISRANNYSSPVSQDIATSQQSNATQQFNKETSQGTPTQVRGTLSRNTGRVQFKGKQSNVTNVDSVIETKNQKVQTQGTVIIQKKRSNIVLYVLKNLFETKIKLAFHQFRQNTKSKPNSAIKMFINKVNLISTKINHQVSYLSFQKLVKTSLSSPIVNKSQALQKLSLNSSKIVYSLLNKIYIKNLKQIFTQNCSSKVHSSHRNKICYSLNSVSKRKLENVFKKLVEKTSERFTLRNQYIHQISKISKSFYSKIYQSSWRKLRLFNKTTDEVIQKNVKTPSKLARSKVQSVQASPEIQDKGVIQKIEKQIADNNKNLQDLNRIFEKEKIEYRNKLTLLGKQSEQFQGYYEYKSKQNQELKQRLSSLQAPEQNYIQDPDLLIETKFPILYELFLKVQKSNGSEINIDDLSATLTIFQDEMRNDQLVNQWLELEQNCWLKKKISRYEGPVEHQRKAAKMAQDEQSLLVDMVASYVKQKYAWQWVKNALASVSLTV